jgi:hypothetical protein
MYVLSLNSIKRTFANWTLVVIGLLLIVFGTYGTFQNSEISTGTIYLIYAFPTYIFLLGLVLLRILMKKGSINIGIFSILEFQLVLLICGLMLIGTMQIPNFLHTAGITTLAAIITGVVFFNLPSGNFDISRFFYVFNLTMYVSTLAALVGGLISFFGDAFSIGPIVFYYEKTFWRMNSWYVTSTGLGIFFVYGIYSAIYFYNRNKNLLLRLLHLIFIGGLVFGITLSGGRTALLCLPISLAAIYAMKIRLTPLFMARVVLITLFVGATLTYIFITYSEEIYILRRFTDTEDASSLGGRVDFLERAVNDFSNFSLSQYLFGVGIGGTQSVLHWSISTHSGVLRILLEYGPFAVLSYLLLFFMTMLSLKRCIKNTTVYKNEYTILGLYLSTFYFAEFMVIQLFGVSMEYCIFLVVLSFFITFRNQENLRFISSMHEENL